MTIEKNIERIAVALEKLVDKMDHINSATSEQVTMTAPVEQVGVSVPPAPPLGILPPQPTTEVESPNVPTPPIKTLTPEALNNVLIEEVKRLGGRGKIDDLLRTEYKVQSLRDIDSSQYQELATKVKALQP